VNEQAAPKSVADASETTLNPFFGKLLVGLAIPFAIFSGLHAIAASTSPQPTAGVLFMGQIASFFSTLVLLTIGLAAFHKTKSPYLKIGGGFLTITGLGLLIYVSIMTAAV